MHTVILILNFHLSLVISMAMHMVLAGLMWNHWPLLVTEMVFNYICWLPGTGMDTFLNFFLAQFTCSSQALGKATSKPQLGLAISLPLLICVWNHDFRFSQRIWRLSSSFIIPFTFFRAPDPLAATQPHGNTTTTMLDSRCGVLGMKGLNFSPTNTLLQSFPPESGKLQSSLRVLCLYQGLFSGMAAHGDATHTWQWPLTPVFQRLLIHHTWYFLIFLFTMLSFRSMLSSLDFPHQRMCQRNPIKKSLEKPTAVINHNHWVKLRSHATKQIWLTQHSISPKLIIQYVIRLFLNQQIWSHF